VVQAADSRQADDRGGRAGTLLDRTSARRVLPTPRYFQS
jgi:hypothetical protein